MPDPARQPTFSPTIALLAIVLTILAGYVDAIGYLSLGHVYVANMSGNSIAVGIHASRFEPWEVWRFAWPILSFAFGLLLSRVVVSWGVYRKWRSLAAPAIALEALALGGFMAFRGGVAGVFLAACAMGIQAATLSRFNGVTVYTSFVTGSLVKFAESLGECVIGLITPARVERSNLFSIWWFFSVWVAYVSGAFLGATALDRLAGASIPFALLALGALAVTDLVVPSQLDKTVPKH